MSRAYTLSDEGLARVLASDPIRALRPEQACIVEEMLLTAFTGENRVPMRTVRYRLDALIREICPLDEAGLRRAVLGALDPV